MSKNTTIVLSKERKMSVPKLRVDAVAPHERGIYEQSYIDNQLRQEVMYCLGAMDYQLVFDFAMMASTPTVLDSLCVLRNRHPVLAHFILDSLQSGYRGPLPWCILDKSQLNEWDKTDGRRDPRRVIIRRP
ncbi:MAG: hypothetical protein WCT40_04030 [Candidatus Magasanikbacteria bacterium]